MLGFSSIQKGAPYLISSGPVVRNATTTNSYTFTNLSIGESADSRYIIVTLFVERSGSYPAVPTSVTVEGKPCTSLTNINVPSSSRYFNISVWITENSHTTGSTTASVVVTGASSYINCGLILATLYNINSRTPISTFLDNTSPFSGTLNITQNGIGIAVGIVTETGTISWNGMTEVIDTEGFSYAYALSSTGNAAYPISFTPSSTSFLPTLFAASFE
jgi:hypothetical protein